MQGVQDAVRKGYDQRFKIGFVDMNNVWHYHKVSEHAAQTGRTTYIGRVSPQCHIKHSELPEKFHVYKGRAVFGGNQIKDENGVQAVFAQQGTSASHMICAKFLDAIAWSRC